MNSLLSRALWGALVAGGITLGGGTAAMAADHDSGLEIDVAAVAEAALDVGLDGAGGDSSASTTTSARTVTEDAPVDATTADGSADVEVEVVVLDPASSDDRPLVDAEAESDAGATSGEDALAAAYADVCASFALLGSASGCTASPAGSGADPGAAPEVQGDSTQPSSDDGSASPTGFGLSGFGAGAPLAAAGFGAGAPSATAGENSALVGADVGAAATDAAAVGRLAVTGAVPVASLGAALGGLILLLGMGGLATARLAPRRS